MASTDTTRQKCVVSPPSAKKLRSVAVLHRVILVTLLQVHDTTMVQFKMSGSFCLATPSIFASLKTSTFRTLDGRDVDRAGDEQE